MKLFAFFESESSVRVHLLEETALERRPLEVPALQFGERIEEFSFVLVVGEHVVEALADLFEEKVLERLQGVPDVFLESEVRQRVDAVVADVQSVETAEFEEASEVDVFLEQIVAEVEGLGEEGLP